MRFMMIVKANKASEAGQMPSAEAVAEMGLYNDELIKAGVLIDGMGLHPSAKGARVRIEPDGRRTVTDGPFSETKELIAGYWLLQVKSREEAIEWARRVPASCGAGETSEIELRQVFEPEDFAGIATPELIAQEIGWREAQLAKAPKV
jgi:hypothetical protein